MALAPLDFDKLPADQHITVWVGLPNAIADFNAPTAAEINAMENVSPALSWQDYDFGIQPSETTNAPSFADPANFTSFGAANYGGAMSFFYPENYHDNSNTLSRVYDLLKTPDSLVSIAIRIDGDKKTTTPAADGDYIHTFLVATGSEANALTGAEELRRTVGFLQQSVFAIYTIVGSKTTKPVPASTTLALTVGQSKRVLVKVLGREFTNACQYLTDAANVAVAKRGGIVTGLSAGTATVTVTNPYTGQTEDIEVTVA